MTNFLLSKAIIVIRLELITSSNHWLESAGLNALEGLFFKMLGMDREDRILYVCFESA